jgi:hypothetical protein
MKDYEQMAKDFEAGDYGGRLVPVDKKADIEDRLAAMSQLQHMHEREARKLKKQQQQLREFAAVD